MSAVRQLGHKTNVHDVLQTPEVDGIAIKKEKNRQYLNGSKNVDRKSVLQHFS